MFSKTQLFTENIFYAVVRSVRALERQTMTVTFKDVAKLAGVSSQTVSRVTNGAENVSEQTRNKVLKAIDQLGYIPNKAAQLLKSKDKIIGLVTLSMTLHGASMIANGVRIRAHNLGYATAISTIEQVSDNEIEGAVRELIGQKVESIILIAPVSKEAAETLSQKYNKFSLLFIDVPEDTCVHKVCSGNKIGAELAAKHLLEIGRSRFILIHGPRESNASNMRHEAWLKTLQSEKAQITGSFEGNWLASGGYRAMIKALDVTRDFDAVLVANDQMALGVMRALYDRNISIPDEVSVVGFDGTEDSEFFIPSLTTIKQNFVKHGLIAVDELLNLKAQSNHIDLVLDVELIIRGSSTTIIKTNTTTEVRALLNKAIRLL